MASPLYADPDGPIRLAVIADSTAFTGPNGPLLPDDPALYPNVAARAIEDSIGRRVAVSVVAHPGTGVRGTYYDVTKNRHVMFEVLMRADAVVLGLGSFDHAPAGVPPVLEGMIQYVRPRALRKRYRAVLRSLHPFGVRMTLGRFARVSEGEFERLFDRILHEVRSLTWGAPGVMVGPTSHRSGYYGHMHPQHGARVELHRRLAREHRFPFVESWPLVEPWIEKLNVDGIHWPFETHEALGRAVAEALIPQIAGAAPAPGIPGYEDMTF